MQADIAHKYIGSKFFPFGVDPFSKGIQKQVLEWPPLSSIIKEKKKIM